MFPFAFEWAWSFDRLLFMGAAGFAISVMGAGLTYCIIKSIYDIATKEGQEEPHH
ncbi:MAG: hypothetical protein ACOC8Q_02670 [Desulfosalsimonas sp.]